MSIERIRAAAAANYRLLTVVGAAVVVVGAILWWLLAGGSGCASDDEAKTKALQLSSDFQAAAQHGKMTIRQLAETTRNLNTAATTYTSTNDRPAYCKTLDEIRDASQLANQ